MALATYKQKRHFNRTSEPEGAERPSAAGFGYVVQKHDASRLHYDFRLELDGVLKSWAVPKGPSLDPGVKRLAVQVEDHPVEYATFEGTIPQGEYGGGTVMVWDNGTWKPEGDPRDGLRRGSLAFELFGRKLKGKWHLTQMHGRGEKGKNWLLFKVGDEYARPGVDAGKDVTSTEPDSTATGRNLDQIAGGGSPVWRSNRKDNGQKKVIAAAATKPPKSKSKKNDTVIGRSEVSEIPGVPGPRRPGSLGVSDLAGAVKAPMPKVIHPELTRYVDKIPLGEEWLHEIKLDGYRILAHIAGGKARLVTRHDNDWTHRFPEIAAAVSRLPVDDAIFDGEVVMLMSDGKSSFQALQNHLRDKSSGSLTLFLFDLIYCNGYDLTKCFLLDRKQLLQKILASNHDPHVRYSDHILGGGRDVYQHACRMGLEGVISKRVAAPYHQTRTADWVKTKCLLRQEFIVEGYTAPTGSRARFGSLLLACHVNGELKYCGKCGAGFTQKTLEDMYARMQPLIRSTPAARPPRGLPIGKATWIEPKIVVEIEFSQWTQGHRLRQPTFQGVREDKKPSEVTMETPKPLGKMAPDSGKPEKKTSQKKSLAGPLRGPGTPANHSTTDIAGVRITHPDRVIYPDQGVTKLELAEYYRAAADWVLPHVVQRPLSIVRCPAGMAGECFFQKHVNETVPPHVRALPVKEENGKSANYIAIDDLEGLIGLVQMNALEIHPWGCREEDIEHPDRLIFDLDPGPGVAWAATIDAAKELRSRLEKIGLESFVKTTGGKGLHIVVPLVPRADWTQAKAFARALTFDMARESPTRYVAVMTKSKREGRIFVDYLRNGRGATAVAAYCTRARPGATVSTPLRWEELVPKIGPDYFTVRNVPKRLAGLKADPWKGFFKTKQSLTESMLARPA